MEFEDRVREHLTSRASRIDTSPPAAVDSINIDRPRQQGPWLAIGAAAAVLVVIGGIGLAAQSNGIARNDATSEVTTQATTATAGTEAIDEEVAVDPVVSTVAVALGSLSIDPLEFTVVEGGPAFDSMHPVVLHGGVTYVIGTVRNTAQPFGSSSLWSTTDGIAWTEISSFPGNENTIVSALIVDDTGFAAIGSRFEGDPSGRSLYGSGGESETLVWTSRNGVEWHEAVLDSSVDSPIPTILYGTAIARQGDRLLVMGVEQPNLEAFLLDRVPQEIRELLGEAGSHGFGWGGPPFNFTINGPGGLVIYSGGADDLGLTEEEEAAINEMIMGPGSEDAVVWISDDGAQWTQPASPPIGYVHGLTSAPDGGFLAIGYGRQPGMWSSPDGVDWESVSLFSQGLGEMVVEGGRILATDYTGMSQSIVEWNGERFVQISPVDAFSEPESWSFRSFTASGRRIGAVAMGYLEEAMEEGGPPVVSLEASNGRTIEIDQMSGTIMVLDENEILLRVRLWEEQSDDFEFDLEAGTVSFLDSESGEVLAEVGIDELDEAQQASYRNADTMEPRSALLYTPDGSNWSVTDLTEVVGPGFDAEQVILVGDTVVVLGRDMTSYDYSSEDPLPAYQVLVASP